MKRFLIFFIATIICLASTSCIGCTPEDVDAFSEGFKEGYFGEDYDEDESY